MREIRGKSPDDLALTLRARLDAEIETFGTTAGFRLHGTNGRQIHRLLARMIDFVETQSGMPSRYVDYSKRGGSSAFEIEHIWADHAERHNDEFGHPTEFAEYRNRLGDLLLLPKAFNASYGDLPYEEKVIHYDSQNLLARSLNPNAYVHNPGFLQFIAKSGLPFRPYATFRKAQIDERQQLYRMIAERIWRPERVQIETAAAELPT